MDSTTAQETIQNNLPFIRYTVNQFMMRCNQSRKGGIVSREDLIQEVALSFLAEVEKHGEEEARRQKYTYLHVMYDTVRKAYPVSISYSGYGKTKCQRVQTIPLHEVRDRLKRKEPSSGIIERLRLREVLEELSQTDNQFIYWLAEGIPQREIAQRMGVTDAAISQRKTRIRARIAEQMRE